MTPRLPSIPDIGRASGTVIDAVEDVIHSVNLPDIPKAPSLFGLPMFESQEILGLNLSPASGRILQALGFEVWRQQSLGNLGMEIWGIKAPGGMLLGEALALLRQSDAQGSYARNAIYRLSGAGACSSTRCYGPELIQWQAQECVERKIGMIDTGVVISSPPLIGRSIVLRRRDSAGRSRLQDDHGTAVATLLVGDPASEFPGLVPRAQLYAADVFFADDEGRPYSDVTAIADALDWLVGSGVEVINLSFGGPHQAILQQAIERVRDAGVVVVAAAGNQGPGQPAQYPAGYPSVIAVTAVDRHRRLYARANRGEHIDLAAPGVGIWTSDRRGAGLFLEGTSFAVPFAAAAALQVRQFLPAATPEQVAADLRRQALDLGRSGFDTDYGWGLLQTSGCNTRIASRQPAER